MAKEIIHTSPMPSTIGNFDLEVARIAVDNFPKDWKQYAAWQHEAWGELFKDGDSASVVEPRDIKYQPANDLKAPTALLPPSPHSSNIALHLNDEETLLGYNRLATRLFIGRVMVPSALEHLYYTADKDGNQDNPGVVLFERPEGIELISNAVEKGDLHEPEPIAPGQLIRLPRTTIHSAQYDSPQLEDYGTARLLVLRFKFWRGDKKAA